MSQRAVVMAIILFAAIVAGMFTFALMKQQELAEQTLPPTVATTTLPYPEITRIDAKHFFQDGLHTVVGSVVLPTPCDLLQSEAVVKESLPEQIQLDFTVINTAEFCAQVETEQRFLITASGAETATFSATFMGRPIILNLVPAAPGETPQNFELFIKG